MKGGLWGLRSTKLSFVVIVLICTTIVMWAWEKAPFLVALLPPESPLVQITPDIFIGSPLTSATSESNMHAGSDLPALARNGTLDSHREHSVDMLVQKDSGKDFEVKDKKVSQHKDGKISSSENDDVDALAQSRKDRANSTAQPDKQEISSSENGKHSKLKKEKTNSSPPASASVSSTVSRNYNRNLTKQDDKQKCNYTKGHWVADNSRPFYSGAACKQWLSEMWACKLNQRTDFSYEKFRWQPKDCQMEEFEASKFLKRMQDKTLAFIGDSLARQQFQSLMCMITGGKWRPDVINVGWEFGLVKARGANRPDGWAYRFPTTNTTILFYWSACLCDLQPLNKKNSTSEIAMHLDRPPSFLQRYLNKFQVIVFNTGHHWNRGKFNANRWIMYVGGVPNTNKKITEIPGAKNLTIHSIVKWADDRISERPNLKVFFRSISPRHFSNGDWNTGGTCDNPNPLSKGKEVLKDRSSDQVAEMAVKGTKVVFLDITALSELRDEGHISRYTIRPTPGMEDCLHWCLPGIPDTWNEIMFAQL